MYQLYTMELSTCPAMRARPAVLGPHQRKLSTRGGILWLALLCRAIPVVSPSITAIPDTLQI